MRRILGVVILSGCVAGAPTEPPDTPAIVGGTIAQPSAYPTVVDLEESPGAWFCTGTLIDKDWVLTAAHCLQTESAGVVNVRFGGNDISTPTDGTVVAAAELDVYPGYTEGPWMHDVALVKLATSVTDRAPSPIDRATIAVGTDVTEVGYGDSDNTGDGAGILRQLETVTADCDDAGDPAISGANLLCFDASMHASCYGDSGGPAFTLAGSVAGITSGGTAQDCTGAGVWDLYTAVAAEQSFIDAFVGSAGATGGSGSSGETGSGSATGTGGTGTDPTGTGAPAVPDTDDGGGCAADGRGSGLAALGVVVALGRRRRRTTSAR